MLWLTRNLRPLRRRRDQGPPPNLLGRISHYPNEVPPTLFMRASRYRSEVPPPNRLRRIPHSPSTVPLVHQNRINFATRLGAIQPRSLVSQHLIRVNRWLIYTPLRRGADAFSMKGKEEVQHRHNMVLTGYVLL
jgi:hypothetical protein